jgi:hypothetical protein
MVARLRHDDKAFRAEVTSLPPINTFVMGKGHFDVGTE